MKDYSKNSLKEEYRLIALKYSNLSEFRTDNFNCYDKMKRERWIDELCSHMYRVNNNWTKEECLEEALKYNTRSEFQKCSKAHYLFSMRRKWLDDICSHMKPVGNLYKRCIYSYEFDDKSVYVGLTSDFERRNYEHLNCTKSPVYKHMKITNSTPKFNILTDYIEVNDSITKEGEVLKSYQLDGWNKLNIATTGAIGSKNSKWAKEICKDIALKFDYIKDFRKSNNACYITASKRGWISEICSHMIRLR